MKKKMLSCLLVVILLSTLSVQTFATDNAEADTQTLEISRTAGKNGALRYNEDTGEMVFVSSEAGVGNDELCVPEIKESLQEECLTDTYNVIGRDDRYKISYPIAEYASTCLIASRFGDDVISGTGWLIDENYVLTAGHMLYYGGRYADHTAVYVGASGGTYKQYRLGHYLDIGVDYVNNSYDEAIYSSVGMFDDWGIIKLDLPVTVNVGHLGRKTVNSAGDMEGKKYYTQGYPTDLNQYVHDKWNQWDMYSCTGYVTGDRFRFLDVVNTDIDSYQGQSGSPIYSYINGYGYCVEAMMVAGNYYENCAILMNSWLMNHIANLP